MTARALCIGIVLWLAGCRATSDPVGDLEDRLLAPCCFRQTLHDHESPIATRLRAEITDRIAAGEHAGDIERDLVARYGEPIRAVPPDGDPRWLIGAVFGVVAVAGLVLLVMSIRRRRSTIPAPAVIARPEDPDDTERLDDALALVD